MSNSAYLFAQVDVIDHKKFFMEYGMPTFDLITKAGGKILFATPEVTVKEGESYGCWTILAKFESEDAVNRFYDSEEYAPLKKLRIEKHSNGGNLFVIPGLG